MERILKNILVHGTIAALAPKLLEKFGEKPFTIEEAVTSKCDKYCTRLWVHRMCIYELLEKVIYPKESGIPEKPFHWKFKKNIIKELKIIQQREKAHDTKRR